MGLLSLSCLSWLKSASLILAFIVFGSTASFASDFAAEIVDVYGQVFITPKATGKAVAAVKGMKVVPGDALETKAKAELELLYDDGNITRIDEKTKITITRMSLEDDKSKQTVLNLAVGRVKNSVSKLSHEKSKFEVQTASAVAGVTGTPPWIVAAIGEGKTQKVEVDLMPEKAGVKTPTAGVFVKGTDSGATKVTLTPGTGTFALAGKPPVMPAPIPPAKLQQLQTAMKITTPPQVQEQKKQELEKKIEEKKEEKKEEAKKEEEKKPEESKGEEKKEDAKAEEAKKEESKQDAAKEEPKETPKETAADGGEKKADAAGGGDASADSASTGGDGGGAAEAVLATGAVGGGTTPDTVSSTSGSTVADNSSASAPAMASAKDSAPSPVSAPSAPSAGAFAGGFTAGGTTGAAGSPDTGSMMNHLTSNVSVGNTVPGTTASTAGDATGAAALPGANQNTLPAAMTKVRVLVTITNK